MQQLFYFLQKYKYLLYFLLLEIIATSLTINNHSFHKSKYISSTNAISGGLFEKVNNINEYINLREENEVLVKENIFLKNKLEQIGFIDSVTVNKNIDTIKFHQKYEFINGKIIQNEYHKAYNYLTINRGKSNGIKTEMGVINSNGIIGIIDNVSNNYARIVSVLNKNTKINARLKNSAHFGTLVWNGENKEIVQLTDIPRQAVIKKGDTIITGGKSVIFPEGIPIGTIVNIPDKISASNTLDIKLFNDMTALGQIYIIISHNKIEVESLNKKPLSNE